MSLEKEKISIYMVEDYLLMRTSMMHIIEQDKDFKILGGYSCAEDFFAAFDGQPSDIVVMDLGLPGMNGIEATRLIKEKSPSTKVVILTSHENEDEVTAALASGASAYCIKDVESKEWTHILKDVYKGALWLHPSISYVANKSMPKPNSTDFDNLYTRDVDVNITSREKETLSLLIEGKSNTEIAKEMHISAHTAKAHVGNILNKLSVPGRVQAAVKAVTTKIME